MIGRLRALVADPSVRWLALARAIALAAAPMALYLLVTRQPVSARGFYLIAINVVALATLFETGMGTLLVQFAARTRPSERGIVRGAGERWYARAAAVVLVIGATLGTWVMARGAASASVDYLVPWLVVLACTAAYVRLVPLVAMLEGAAATESVQRMRAVQAVAVGAATVAGLWSGRGIAAAAWAAVAQLAVGGVFVMRFRGQLPPSDPAVGRLADSFRTEQARSARVWIALWAAPQLLTPAAMLLRDATVAGDLGLHVALALAPPVISVAWLHARYPRLGALVASGALQTFDETAWFAFVQAAKVYGAASALLLILALAGPLSVPFLAGDVLSPATLALLLAGSFVLVVMQAMLAWMRAFGDEKFAQPVVLATIAMAFAGVVGAGTGGSFGASLAFFAAGIVVLAVISIGFLRLRSQRLGKNV